MLSSKRFAITARMFDTGTSMPSATSTPFAGTVGLAATGAPSRSLDVMELYKPVPFRPYKKIAFFSTPS